MLQFYFLSILFNLIAGYLFVFGQNSAADASVSDMHTPLDGKTFRLVAGILSVVTGLVKLFSPVGSVAVVGDIIPAVAGLAGGFCLLLDYYMSTTTIPVHFNETFESIIIGGRKYIGVGVFAAGVLHFLFPHALFL